MRPTNGLNAILKFNIVVSCNHIYQIFVLSLPIKWIPSTSTTLLSSATAAPMILPTPSVLNALHVYSESMKFDVSKTYDLWMDEQDKKKPIQIEFRYWIPHEWFQTDKSPREKNEKKMKQKKLAYNKIDFTLLICTEKCFNSLIRWIYIRIPASHDKCSVPIAIELRIIPQFVRLKQWN